MFRCIVQIRFSSRLALPVMDGSQGMFTVWGRTEVQIAQ